MPSFTKTLSLLTLMAAGGTQIANACDCDGCSSTTFSGSTTISSSCSSSQTSSVEKVKIAINDDYGSSFSYSAGSCSSGPTTCESGSSCGETNSVSITCERSDNEYCALKYDVSWKCVDSASTSTSPNEAWTPGGASLVCLATTAVAAVLQI